MNTRNENRRRRFVLLASFLSALWILSRCGLAQDIPVWAQNHGRTQAGGWIWFPGKYTAETEIEADLMSKGMAIAYLIQECQIAHREVKFNERFVEERKGKITVHVLASIEDKHCNEGKRVTADNYEILINRQLLEPYRAYRTKLADIQTADVVCDLSNTYCMDYAIAESEMVNVYKTLSYLQRACYYGYGCKSVQETKQMIWKNDL